MTMDLFAADDASSLPDETLAPGAMVLRGFALPYQDALWADLQRVTAEAPMRHMITPGGFTMSVAMTNCGLLGWLSDETGYRYDRVDPDSGKAWPAMPASFASLATRAAEKAGFPGFTPDACLVNRYTPGARLSLHQDRNERDKRTPIVSVSLGLPAVFLFGGTKRTDKTIRVPLQHADVAVWGGPSRLNYHGVLALKEATPHHLIGGVRVNLTFRKAA
jgi:alkylated DNA repair protein (DNA oxidative demethylase)